MAASGCGTIQNPSLTPGVYSGRITCEVTGFNEEDQQGSAFVTISIDGNGLPLYDGRSISLGTNVGLPLFAGSIGNAISDATRNFEITRLGNVESFVDKPTLEGVEAVRVKHSVSDYNLQLGQYQINNSEAFGQDSDRSILYFASNMEVTGTFPSGTNYEGTIICQGELN